MSSRRSDGPADRAESERLLDAARDGRPPADADPLRHLLAAAAAPANPGELSGEEQAMTAFRAARVAPAFAPAPAPRRRRLRVGAAAWVAGLAATATAGVAFAAVSLDRPEQPTSPPAPTTPGSSSSGVDGSPSPTRGADPTGSSPGTPASTGPSVAPGTTGAGPGRPATTAQLTGLCRSYLAKSPEQRAKALETPSFGDLVSVAGGADRVEDYCLRLVPEASPNSSPSRGAARSTRPTPAAPTGKPSTGTDR
ncbi:hypothetical protein U2F26_09500 [Micromonospora sp. 4G57]|uniref:Uncharacterized protein n=1 Tax=Micromonospora sicca TaxID=2202420 RepID=A0ABU5J6W0_9ACTN|nr:MULTISPECIES: hypothetical protein [unclassified Micromonospora]MDZ5442969.1 hypothetical protein [Micromonospora sp. 4G57]MDZ5488320.1 hypothetical protein [Micromonospora sp. 4G53]